MATRRWPRVPSPVGEAGTEMEPAVRHVAVGRRRRRRGADWSGRQGGPRPCGEAKASSCLALMEVLLLGVEFGIGWRGGRGVEEGEECRTPQLRAADKEPD